MTSRKSELEERAERELAKTTGEAKRKRQGAGRAKVPGEQAAGWLPRGFVMTDSEVLGPPGLYTIPADGVEAIAAHDWICSPFRVLAYTRDAANSEWGKLIELTDPEGIVHRLVIPAALLGGRGEELRALLLREGLDMATDQRRRAQLLEVLSRAKPSALARCVPRAGWHGLIYVTGSRTYGETGGEQIVLQTNGAETLNTTPRGSLEKWKANVSAPCVGNTAFIVGLCCAFAAPALGLVEGEPFGLNLMGRSTGGKTTVQLVSVSVYGPPEFCRSWRTTDSALESVAVLHSDGLLVLDELGQIDPKVAAAAAYMLGNGVGRARAYRDGTARAVSRFRVLFLSSGEISLADLVAQAGQKSRAGHGVRLIDVPADFGGDQGGVFEVIRGPLTPGEFSERLKAAAREHCGHAGPEWLKILTDNPLDMRAVLVRLRDGILGTLVTASSNGQVRRVAARFAILAAAGELATQKGLTGWPQGEAERAIRKAFDAWLNARGTSGAAEPAQMIAAAREFIARHGDARFQIWSEYNRDHRARVINRAGWRRESTDPGGLAWFVEAETFRSELAAGHDHAAFARALHSIGALRTGSGGELSRTERLPDGRKARCYVLLPALFGDQSAPVDADPEEAAA